MFSCNQNGKGARWARVTLVLALVLGMLAVPLVGCSSGDTAKASSSSASSASSDATAGKQSSSAGEAADDMTVTVTMKESVTKATDVDTPLQFAEESIEVKAPEGSNALELLQGTGREVKVEGSGDAAEVTAIGGLENGDAGAGSHWTLQLNGESVAGSPATCMPKNGDTLTWNFVK